MKNLSRIFGSVMATLLLISCAVGPDYKRPAVVMPVKYKEAKNWKQAKPRDLESRGKWWKVFHDPQLNALEEKVLIQNQNIINADANFRQAHSLIEEARASFLPTVTGSASITRQNNLSSSSSSSGPGASVSTSHSLILDAVWEADIWGSIRRTVEASVSYAQSQSAVYAATQLSSEAALAQSYFEIRTLDADQQLLNNTVKQYRRMLNITRKRYNAGIVARSDVIQSQSLLESAEAQAINNKISRAQFEHAIAVLIGEPPAMFSLMPNPLNVTPPMIPAEVPSLLLERRPDIASAERLMAQANAQVGIAVAAYYPTLTITATGTVQNNGYANWFSLPSLAWAIGPQLTETIFNGGALLAATDAARANYDATVATYRQTVLNAFQDVEDNLVSQNILAKEAVVQDKAAEDARHALKIVINEYKAGTASYSDVMLAEINAFSAEKNAKDIAGLRMTAAVGLIKALGGGWTVDQIPNL